MNRMIVVQASLMCILALLALLLQGAGADDSQNATVNLTVNQSDSLEGNMSENQSHDPAPAIILGSGKRTQGKVLRAGFQEHKAVNDLDMYGNRSIHVIPPQVPAQWAFDLSQRVGNVSKFNFASNYKPLYSLDQYTRTKAIYQVPSSLSSKPVYSISGYPRIKIANGIP